MRADARHATTGIALAALASVGCLDLDPLRDKYGRPDDMAVDAAQLPPPDAGEVRDSAEDVADGSQDGESDASMPEAGVVVEPEPDAGAADAAMGDATDECGDGMRSGDESDVDCGGSCAPCGEGLTCGRDEDCVTGLCLDEVCAAPGCGDGIVGPGEDCDPEGRDTELCDRDCSFVDCGDALLNTAAGEQCDDGNESARDGCDATCQRETEVTYAYLGEAERYVVPPGVSRVLLEAWGAQGFTSGDLEGGRGGYAEGVLDVSVGDVLYVRVGQMGRDRADAFNGGQHAGGACGSGGGASDVRVGGQGLDRRVVVAGGGGASVAGVANGGPGGGAMGRAATWTGSAAGSAGAQGQGGTQSAGGAKGAGGGGTLHTDGQLGLGGVCAGLFSGGGGGGYFGGGGGDGGGGGGGGSSYLDATLADADTDVGVRDGHGQVRITVVE